MRSALAFLSLVVVWLLPPASLVAQSAPPGGAPASLAIAFGSAVAISGQDILVGRPGLVLGFPVPPSQTGAIHVFRRGAGGKWGEVAKVVASGLKIEDGFGSSIALDGKFMAVGAPGTAEQRGAVYVFERDGTGRWLERAQLTSATPAANDQFGRSVALKGKSVV